MNPQLAWYTGRAAGIVAFVLVTLAVILGLMLATRITGRRPAPAWVLDVHRMISALAVVFVGLHLLGIWVDSYIELTLADFLVPFAADWHPLATAAGVVGLYLLLAVEITSLLRSRLSQRAWKATHHLSYVLFWVAALHMSAGTDAGNMALRVVALASIGLVLFLTLFRVLAGKGNRRGRASVPQRIEATRDSARRAA